MKSFFKKPLIFLKTRLDEFICSSRRVFWFKLADHYLFNLIMV